MTIIEVGSFYEDCAYHPCLCISCDEELDEVLGISLIDGSTPRSCSLSHCGIKKISLEEVLHLKFYGPKDAGDYKAPWVNSDIKDPRC